MTVMVAVPDSPEGVAALAAAAAEADLLGTDLVAVNLALKPLDTSSIPAMAIFSRMLIAFTTFVLLWLVPSPQSPVPSKKNLSTAPTPQR